MTPEYLLKEYELCFEQLRFYDTRHEDLTKYLFTLASAVAAAEFAVLEFLKSTTPPFYASLAVLSLIVFVATILLYVAMLQNRLYFVFVARQINAIRGYLMATEAPGFKGNQMYTRVDLPAFRFRSLHTVSLAGTALISSVFAGSTAYGVTSYLALANRCLIVGLATVLAAVLELALGVLYLQSSGRQAANDFLATEKGKPEQPNPPYSEPAARSPQG